MLLCVRFFFFKKLGFETRFKDFKCSHGSNRQKLQTVEHEEENACLLKFSFLMYGTEDNISSLRSTVIKILIKFA